MAIGDDAAADGMDLVPGSAPANTLDTEENKTRDYIVQRIRTARDWVTGHWPLSIARGGTGADDADEARANLGAVKDGIGTGLEFYSPGFNRLAFKAPGVSGGTEIRLGAEPTGSYLPLSGGTLSGDLYIPGSTAATSGYTVAYINADGRVSRGASSERYKEDITLIEPASLGSLFPDLYTFRMIGSDTPRIGWIAERLAEDDALRPFVVYARTVTLGEDGSATEATIMLDADGNPVPESIDFISLLIAQNAQLHARVAALEATHASD